METLKMNRVFLLVNVCLVMYIIFTSMKPVPDPVILKGKGLELTDDKGIKRATIKVEEGGEVVFRLLNSKGEIRVKMGASDEGSGIVLLNDSTEPGLHALAKHTGGALTLFDEKGNAKPVRP